MKKSEWNEGLNHIDNDLVVNYIEQKELLQNKKKKRAVWLRACAIAACLAIVLSLIFTVVILVVRDEDATGVDGTNSIPIWDTPQISMEDIYGKPKNDGSVEENEFGCEVIGIHSGYDVPDPKYLYIKEMKNYEYLPIYHIKNDDGKALDEQEFNDFSGPFLQKSEEWFGIESSKYQNISDENDYYIEGVLDGLTIRTFQNKYYNGLTIGKKKQTNSELELNGQPLQIDENLSDEEIIASLSSLKETFFEFFGVSFTDATVARRFYDYGKLTSITVYFYNENDVYDPFEKNSFNEDMRFTFSFDYDYDKKDYEVDYVSIKYSHNRQKFDERYQTVAQAKLITLEKAVEFLRKGYFLPTLHGKCKQCWEWDKINFAEYDFVEIEYSQFRLANGQGYFRIPYYIFYKEVPQENITRTFYTDDCRIYETVKVPAIEIAGYEEYFAMEKKYKLQISKPTNVKIRNEIKDSYSEGEPVCVALDIINGYYNVYVNDIRVDFNNCSSEHLFYNFVMPAQDVIVSIEPKYNVPIVPSQKVKSTE